MAKIFKLFGGKGEEKAVQSVLMKLDRKKSTVRLELENTQVRFNTVIAYRRNTIVVAKPQALEGSLKSGTMVRFSVPDDNRDIRMEIATPHFNLTNGSPVFLCHPPRAFAKSSDRISDRFGTQQFNNLLLHIPGNAHNFRILDLSTTGCRIETTNPNPRQQFPVARDIGDAWIQLGKRAKVSLENIIPRSHHGQSVGLEITVSASGNNGKLLAHLVNTLEKQQKETLKAAPF